MTFFVSEIVTAPARLPITVAAAQADLAAAVVEEIERAVLWRGIVLQTRRILIDGPLPPRLELEPIVSLTSLTRWTAADAAEVIPAADYISVSRDPSGTIIEPAPGKSFPAPERSIGSFALTYTCGFGVTDTSNAVPASVQLMVERAIDFRAGSGLDGFTIGSLKIGVADSYSTDALPPEIASIGRAWAYRPGLFAGRP